MIGLWLTTLHHIILVTACEYSSAMSGLVVTDNIGCIIMLTVSEYSSTTHSSLLPDILCYNTILIACELSDLGTPISPDGIPLVFLFIESVHIESFGMCTALIFLSLLLLQLVSLNLPLLVHRNTYITL